MMKPLELLQRFSFDGEQYVYKNALLAPRPLLDYETPHHIYDRHCAELAFLLTNASIPFRLCGCIATWAHAEWPRYTPNGCDILCPNYDEMLKASKVVKSTCRLDVIGRNSDSIFMTSASGTRFVLLYNATSLGVPFDPPHFFADLPTVSLRMHIHMKIQSFEKFGKSTDLQDLTQLKWDSIDENICSTMDAKTSQLVRQVISSSNRAKLWEEVRPSSSRLYRYDLNGKVVDLTLEEAREEGLLKHNHNILH